MKQGLFQAQKLSQELTMAPQQIQSLEILVLPMLELQQKISQEMEINPTLEVTGGGEELVGDILSEKLADSPPEEQLAGVLGHEIAHADLRHSSRQIQSQYGISILINVLLGKDPGTLVKIAQGLTTLKFSRAHESEADKYSVIYLCPTIYNADGAAGFFEKMTSSGSTSSQPTFLSTHPNPANRVIEIRKKRKELACGKKPVNKSQYRQLKNSLPK